MKDFFNKFGLGKRLVAFIAIISFACIATIAFISYSKSKDSMLMMSENQLGSMGELTAQRLDEFFLKSEAFSRKLIKDRLVEGLFISYETAFYGGAFMAGEDLDINSPQYGELKAKYEGRPLKMVQDYGFSNMLLVSMSGQVIFSAVKDTKNNYLGRSITEGQYKGTLLQKCYNQAYDANDNDTVFFSKFFFNSITGATTAFLCGKQFAEFDYLSDGIKKGDPLGVVINEVNVGTINAIVAQRVGMGETGQAYLVAGDKTLRSDFFLESEKFNVKNSILEGLTIDTESVSKALAGETGKASIVDPTGHEVLSFYKPLKVFGNEWAVVAEKRLEEIMSPVTSMVYFVLIASAVIFAVIMGVTLWVTKIIVSPIFTANEVLRKIAGEVTGSSHGMKENSGRLNEGAEEIASSIQNTASTLDELTSMVNKNLTNVNESNKKSQESETVAENGKSSVTRMLGAMDDIDRSNEDILGEITEISSKMTEIIGVINEIGSKTQMINDIVFQTKLLSFNASVEAARAGEHGKGFAVVAEEVGSLAFASGNAANEISTMLDDSVKRVEKIVTDATSKIETIKAVGKEKVDVGIKTAKECEDALTEILANVKDVGETISEIAEASTEQSTGIEQVSKAISQLDLIATDTSRIANESQVSSDDLSVNAGKLDRVVDDLTVLVYGVSDSVQNQSSNSLDSDGHSGSKQGAVESSDPSFEEVTDADFEDVAS